MPLTIVQAAATVHNASLTTASVTLASPTSAGSSLVVLVTTNGASANPVVSAVTLGGAAGNFAQVITDNPNVSFGGSVWYDPGCTAGQTAVAVTCTSGAGSNPEIYVTVYEVAAVLAADKSTSNVATGSTSWTSTATATTTRAAEIFFAAAMCSPGQAPAVTGAGTWTTQNLVAGVYDQVAGYQVVASTGTATFSGTQTSGAFVAMVATFYDTAPARIPDVAMAPMTGG